MAEKNENTGYYPKAGDELKFYLKHIIKLIKHGKPYENEKQFKGGTKVFDRKKDRHGYMPGEDRKVYENIEDYHKNNIFRNDPVKKKRMQGKDWHSKPADTSHMSLSGDRLKKAVKAHTDEYKKNPEEYARKMSEEKDPKNPYAEKMERHSKWRAIKDDNQEKAKKRKEARADIERAKEMNEAGRGIRPFVSSSGKTSTVFDSDGNKVAEFNAKEHGPNHEEQANAHLRQNYDKYNSAKPTLRSLLNKTSTVNHAKNRHPGMQEEGMKSVADVIGESVSDLLAEERKVSSGATKAFLNKGKFKSKNTHVHDEDGVHVMKLHGNLIAKHHPDGKVEVTHAGWGTKTTKERTNSIARAVGASGFSTRKHQLHHGDKPIDDDQWVTLRDNK